MHLGHPGERRHDGPQERGPAAEEDGRSTSPTEEVLRTVDAVPVPVEGPQLHDPATEVAADLEADGVADDGGDHDHDEDRRERHVPERGRDAAEDGDRLTRHDEADEERVLDEDQPADDEEHEPHRGMQDLGGDGVEQGAHVGSSGRRQVPRSLRRQSGRPLSAHHNIWTPITPCMVLWPQ